MLDGGTAIVRVVADASKLNQTIMASTRGATSGIAGLGAKVSSALSNPFVIAGGVVTGVVAKMGYDFEETFSRIDAISNASSADIANWRKEIMTLGAATAQSPKDLGDALYFLASAGLKANEVFPALEASAKAAAIGLGSVAQVGSVVAAVLNAYAGSGLTATDVTDTLVAAVRESRAETDEFGQTLGRLLPISARAGISFGELAGSLASLSNIGLDVYEAATAMRAAIQAIVAPGEKAANALESVGITSQELLDAIHQKGLLGALKLLDREIQANTDSESEYLRTFRDIVPNVRALTGVLGLTGANLEHVESIFKATTHATGDAAEAFNTFSSGPAFKFKDALTDIIIMGTELGTNVLPIITFALQVISPLLKIVAENAGKLLVAFIAYKALTWLPALLTAIGIALTGMGGAGGAKAAVGIYAAARATGHLGTKAVVAEGVLAKLGTRLKAIGGSSVWKALAGRAVLAYQLGDTDTNYKSDKTDLRDIEARLTTIRGLKESLANQAYIGGAGEGMIQGIPQTRDQIIELIATLGRWNETWAGNQEAFRLAAASGISYSDALWTVSYAGDELNKHQSSVNKSIRQTVREVQHGAKDINHVTKAYQRWGFATDKAFSDFKEDVRESVQVGIGEFEHFNDAFKTTPAELSRQLGLAIQIARTKGRDLRKILGDKDLTKGQKRALASMPADFRHAWVAAGDAGNTELQNQLTKQANTLQRLNTRTFNRLAGIITPKAKKSGSTTGSGYGQGIVNGLNFSQGAVYKAASRLARLIDTTVRGILDEESPSKVAKQTGAFYVEGLIIGLKSREKALEMAASHLTDVLVDQLGKSRDKFRDVLDKLKSDLQEKLGDAFTKADYLNALKGNAAAAAAQAAIDLARTRVKEARELTKELNRTQKALDRLVDKFKEFKQSIKDGFSDFAGLGGTLSSAWQQYVDDLKSYQEEMAKFTGEGDAPVAPTKPDFGALIQQQVADAQRLAKALTDAAALGLSKGLLAQFAGEGLSGALALEQLIANPALIAELNQAAQVISRASEETASALGNKFFGKAIHEATVDFKLASVALKGFIKAMIEAMGALGATRQLQHLLDKLNAALAAAPSPGGGGGGNGSGPAATYNTGWNQMPNTPNAPAWKPSWEPTWEPTWKPGGGGNNVTVHVNGWVGSDQDIAKKFRDELVRVKKNNGGTGL